MPPIRHSLVAAAACAALLPAASAAPPTPAGDDGPPRPVREFLDATCLDCHAGPQAAGGLDLAALSFDPAIPGADARWARVIDRVAAGEMPPPDEARLDDAARAAFVAAADPWLARAVRDRDAAFGRVRARRLSPREIERSLHALLGVDIPLASLFPAEGRPGGFTTVAERQTMSHHQLERHVAVVDAALDEAFRRALAAPVASSREFAPAALARTDPAVRCREPELLDDRAVVWTTWTIFYGRLPATTSPADGWYRFRLRIVGLNPPETGGVWTTVHSGVCLSSAPLLGFVTAFESRREPREIEFDAWLPRGHMLEIRPGDITLAQGRFEGGHVGAGEGAPQRVPGIGIERLTMSRVHRGPDAGGVRALLFGDVPLVEDETGAFRPRPGSAAADLDRLVRAFARRAFRRPVAAADVEPIAALAQDVLAAGGSFAEAVRAGYRGVLCAPRFLYLVESPGPLDDHAVAARLALFLTGGPPDAALAALADAGRLREPATLRRQADRLLGVGAGTAGRAATRRFAEDFAAEWLDLDQIDFTEPDRKLFRDFDPVVQHSMLAETHAFLEEMLLDDRPVSWLVSADVGHLNSRLARFYGIPDVAGDEIRRVALPPATHRGGLLTQGAILKVTANGSTTSPVVRGAWVAERLLGIPAHPPPSGVPAVEPDIRGATTIRAQLARHRADPACASCHRAFEPIGFALENFDPSGKWRARYPAVVDGRHVPGPTVDAADVLEDGRAFASIDEFKALAVRDAARIARGVAGQLLVYGTGATLSYADRRAVAEIAAASGAGHGLRSLVHAVVTHPVFLNK